MRVIAINPGLTLTERLHEGMQAEARQQGITTEEALTRAKATRPLGRIAEPSEIADAVVYLASKRASCITGAVVAMDGAVTPMVVWVETMSRVASQLVCCIGSAVNAPN